MKKAYKALSILMIVVMIAFTCTTVLAAGTDVLSHLDGKDTSVNTGSIGTIGNKILTIITTVGMVLAVVIVAILGIKYMMGSTEEKAEYKKSMIPYIVGAVLVFGASAIGRTVVSFGQSITAA